MQKNSVPSGQASQGRLTLGSFVESLESRQLLAATPLKTAFAGRAVTAAKTIVPGITYRPASDSSPTKNAGKNVRTAAGKNSKAYTNYLQLLPQGMATPSAVGSATPVGLTAAQVRGAYGMDAVSFNGIVGDGTGQTIAIVDAYDHPGFVNSTDPNYLNSDLHQFSVGMGLPDPPSFTKIDQNGGTNYPAPNAGWAAEIALDVEWAHAMAPNASIVLVEANSNSFGDLVQAAVNTARNLPNVSVVSMSFGFDGGFSGETYFDQFFATPSGHNGVTFVASSGDHGATTPAGGVTASAAYPAESPNVIAVGGTSLTQNANAYVSETGWSGSGGGISNFETKPAYQNTVTQSSTFRTTPDVSILGDPGTGVAVYDSYNNTSGGGWNNFLLGGTSLSAPLWAGVMAVANQGRSAIGLGSLNGPTQGMTRLYQLPTSTLHDVTSGSNGAYTAASGYDLVTGRGTPVGQSTVTGIAGGSYSGTAYIDKNGDGAFNGNDTPLAGVTVFNDTNNNAALDGNESSATTNANGVWTIDVASGIALSIREFTPNGYLRTSASRLIGSGTTAYGVFNNFGSFGNFPTTYTLPAGNNTVTLRTAGGGNTFQVFINTPSDGTPTYSITKSLLTGITINGNTADDVVNLDLTNGSPLLSSAAITFNGGTQNANDVLNVIAAAAGSTVRFTTAGVSVGSSSSLLNVSGVELRNFVGKAGNDSVTFAGTTAATSPVFTGGGGNDTVSVSGVGTYQANNDLGGDGTNVSVAANQQGNVVFAANQRLAALSLNGAGTATLASGGLTLRTSALAIDTTQSSYLDVTDGGLIVDYTTASPNSTIAALIASGFAAGAWNGLGIRSSTAAAGTTGRYGVGSGEAATVLGLSGSATGTFRGQTVDSTTVLVRYTLRGDASLNGTVDFNDFLALQNNFNQPAGRTFADGDFDYDGDADFNDFLLLQNNFGASV